MLQGRFHLRKGVPNLIQDSHPYHELPLPESLLYFRIDNEDAAAVLELHMDDQLKHLNSLEPGRSIFVGLDAEWNTAWSQGTTSFILCYGVMQPQGHLQVLLNMHHFKVGSQAALDAPRICLDPSGVVFVEEGIQRAALAELKRLEHNIRVMSGWERVVFGRGQVSQVTEDAESPTGRVLAAGSDGPADGMALGY